MYRLQDFWQQLLGTVGIGQKAGGGASKKGVGSLPPEIWPKILYLSPVTISSTFQTNLTALSKHGLL